MKKKKNNRILNRLCRIIFGLEQNSIPICAPKFLLKHVWGEKDLKGDIPLDLGSWVWREAAVQKEGSGQSNPVHCLKSSCLGHRSGDSSVGRLERC